MFSDYPDLPDFVKALSTSDPLKMSKQDTTLIRFYVHSDGCTGVPDFFLPECQKHDFYYRTHHNFECKMITRAEADARFRKGMQSRSRFGVFSPVSWWRWAGVRVLAGKAWERKASCHG